MDKNKGREEAEESRRGRGGVCGQVARSAARKGQSMEKKSGACLTMESAGALQRRHS